MKNSITFLLILITFNFSEVKAQQSDSTAILTVMKTKSQIFIAEILTDSGLRKGIFYKADSSEVVILDSLFHPIKIALEHIKTLDLRRSNASGFSFRIGFGATLGFSAGIALLLASDGLGKFVIASFAVGVPLALLVGGVAVLLATAPNIRIRNDVNPKLYLKSLKYLKERSQIHLLKIEARKFRNKT
jgi:hypothetical protein